MSKLYCSSGEHHPYYCLCPETCSICGISTNHTTAQHEQAEKEQMMCHECGEQEKMDDDPETRLCRACADEYWQWREELYYDNLAKDEGGQA